MEEPKEWDELVGALIEISDPLLERMSIVPMEHVPVRIIDAMFLKSVDTLRAIRLLYSAGLPVQAQALIRILLEVRIDIELFMRACVADPAAAARKVLDATWLQKISQQRQSNFIGLSSMPGAPSREKCSKTRTRSFDNTGTRQPRRCVAAVFQGFRLKSEQDKSA
jgi:hypothetical protein